MARAELDTIEQALSKALADMLNYRGPHRANWENNGMQMAANKAADAIGDIRFMKSMQKTVDSEGKAR